MNKINTVVFDMDGTVLNTLDDLTVSMNYVLEKFNMQGHTLDEYKAFFGNGIEYAMRKSVPDGTDDETIARMLPVFKKHYDKHCLDKTRPYDGILELMNSLKTKGYKMAIVSNKIDSAVKELQKKFFADLVDVAIGEKPGIKRKPAPDTVNEALRLLNSSPDEAIYIDHDLPENGFVEVLIIDQKIDKPVINKVFDSHGEYMHRLSKGEYELYFRVIENSKGTINVYTQKNK